MHRIASNTKLGRQAIAGTKDILRTPHNKYDKPISSERRTEIALWNEQQDKIQAAKRREEKKAIKEMKNQQRRDSHKGYSK